MKLDVSILSCLSVLLLISGCAQTKLYDYKPTTAQEQEVYDFFVECDKAIGEKNLDKFMSCFNDDAKMRVFIGAGTMTWVSKEELRERLEDGLWDRYRWESNSFKNPKITVNGSQATVKGNIPGSGNWVAKHTVELNKEDNQWGITKWDCRW